MLYSELIIEFIYELTGCIMKGEDATTSVDVEGNMGEEEGQEVEPEKKKVGFTNNHSDEWVAKNGGTLKGGDAVFAEVRIPTGYMVKDGEMIKIPYDRSINPNFDVSKKKGGRSARWTKKLQKIFMDSISNGSSQVAAIKNVGFSVSYIHKLKTEDHEFKEQLENALLEKGQRLEEEAYRRSMPFEEEVWHSGEMVGTRLTHSDSLLQTMLKGAIPEKYSNNANVNISGQLDSKVEVTEGAAKNKLLDLLGVTAIELNDEDVIDITDQVALEKNKDE